MNKINHIAVIMDGNGRWGKKEKIKKFWSFKWYKSYRKNSKRFNKNQNTNYNFYTFSTENWKRPKKKLSFFLN